MARWRMVRNSLHVHNNSFSAYWIGRQNVMCRAVVNKKYKERMRQVLLSSLGLVPLCLQRVFLFGEYYSNISLPVADSLCRNRPE